MKKINKLIENFLDTGKVINEDDGDYCDKCDSDNDVIQTDDGQLLCGNCHSDMVYKSFNFDPESNYGDPCGEYCDDILIKKKETIENIEKVIKKIGFIVRSVEYISPESYEDFSLLIKFNEKTTSGIIDIHDKGGTVWSLGDDGIYWEQNDFEVGYNDTSDTFSAIFGTKKYLKKIEGYILNYVSINKGGVTTTIGYVRDFFKSRVRGSEKYFDNIFNHLEDITEKDEVKIKDIVRKIYDYIEDNPDVTRDKLKGLIRKIGSDKLKGDFDELFVFVSEYKKYEKSFCGCEGDYFECTNLGDRSTITPISISKKVKEYHKNKTPETLERVINDLYDSINNENINKYDITSNKDVKLEGGYIIKGGSKIEVKNTTNTDYHLSEFLTLYKTSTNIDKYLTNKNHIEEYNSIVSGVLGKLKENQKGIIEKIKSETAGIFLSDYEYCPFDEDHIEIYWSNEGQRKTIKRKDPKTGKEELYPEYRLSIRFRVIGKTYKWVNGNCNLQKETPDNVSEYVNNLLDL